jgi:hypothetical protein
LRAVEHTLSPEEYEALQLALNDDSGSEGSLWQKDIDLGEGDVVALAVFGGGKDDRPWIDVIVSQMGGVELEEPRSLDMQFYELGQVVIPDLDVVLSVMDGATPAPGM